MKRLIVVIFVLVAVGYVAATYVIPVLNETGITKEASDSYRDYVKSYFDAGSFLTAMKKDFDDPYEIEGDVQLSRGLTGYRLPVPKETFAARADKYLALRFGAPTDITGDSYGYENASVVCYAVNGGGPSGLPYVWCANKPVPSSRELAK